MRTQAKYGSVPSGWTPPTVRQPMGSLGKGGRKAPMFDPERYPLYIGNKLAQSSRFEYVSLQPDQYRLSGRQVRRVQWVSSVVMALYYTSYFPLSRLLSKYLTDRWSSELQTNSTRPSPNLNPAYSNEEKACSPSRQDENTQENGDVADKVSFERDCVE